MSSCNSEQNSLAMAKKKPQAQKPRTDAERRARQCERLARGLRTLRCISGPGRWDVQALSEELECSPRTVQRILQTLSMAGVPFRYDAELRAYRVPSGFRFPGLDIVNSSNSIPPDLNKVHISAKQLIRDGERFLKSLQAWCDQFEE